MFPEARGVEFLIIAALALVVVGPKELPGLLRKLGQFVAKMRNIANDFRTSFDEMARQSELDDLRKQVEEMRSQAASLPYDPTGVTDAMNEFQASMNSAPDYGAASPSREPASEPAPEPAQPAKPKRAVAKKPAAAKPAAKASAKPKAKRRPPSDIVR